VLIAVIVLLNIGCDKATKHAARAHLRGRDTMSIVGNVLVLRYAENDGAFLSLGARLPKPLRMISFIAFPIIVLGFMVGYIARSKETAWAAIIGLSFIVGGGWGNLIDRLFRDGRVSDFINIGIGSVRTGIFNFADLSILIGCLLLVASPWKRARTE
jgi:signal peptidase II